MISSFIHNRGGRSRRLLGAVLCSGVAVALLAGCTSSIKQPDEESSPSAQSSDAVPVTIGLTYVPNVQFAAVYLAQQEGYFDRVGVSVQIRHHGADEGLFTQLLAGGEDIVVASADEMLQARSQGMDLISVGQYYAEHPVTVIVKDDSPIESFADLKGKKVGIPGEFGSNWFALLAGLQAASLSRDDLTIMPIGYTQVAALQADQVDAIIGFSNNDAVQLAQSGQAVREIPVISDRELPLVGASLITTRSFAQSHPQELKAALEAIGRGMEAYVADPQAAVEATANYDPSGVNEAALATARATAKLFAPDDKVSLLQDSDRWAAMNEFLASLPDVLGAKVDITTAVTNDFAPGI